VSGLKGLQSPAPVLAGVFTVAMMASIGLPGLNGFVGEFLVLIGTFVAHRWWAVAATAGVIVAAVYLLWAYQQGFHGEPTEADTKTRDLGWNERLVIAPLVILIVALGVFPKPVLDRINPSVNQLVVHVDQVTHTRIPAGLDPGPVSAPVARHAPGAPGTPGATPAAPIRPAGRAPARTGSTGGAP
jgi:NADH-quinone oxidoreductase subunit M